MFKYIGIPIFDLCRLNPTENTNYSVTSVNKSSIFK